jgi:hypothetical protein
MFVVFALGFQFYNYVASLLSVFQTLFASRNFFSHTLMAICHMQCGLTALILASRQGRTESVQELIICGADKDAATNVRGKSIFSDPYLRNLILSFHNAYLSLSISHVRSWLYFRM